MGELRGLLKEKIKRRPLLKRTLVWARDAWYSVLNILVYNALIRALFFYLYKAYLLIRRPSKINLHLGCGNVHKKGYTNIDHRKTSATDLVCDVMRLPHFSSSVDLIETYHVIEHISHRHIETLFSEWHRVLKPNGLLVIECPDFNEAIEDYLAGNESRLFNIFGWQRFKGDAHLFGYNFDRLKKCLERCGFGSIERKEPQDYHRLQEPCLRVECRKLRAKVRAA